MSLASTFAPDGNEALAPLQLVGLLQLKGYVMTADDALHCLRAVAAAISARVGDYVPAFKANRPGLLRDAEAALAAALSAMPADTVERAHDGQETRRAEVLAAADMFAPAAWPCAAGPPKVSSNSREERIEVRRFRGMDDHIAHDSSSSLGSQSE